MAGTGWEAVGGREGLGEKEEACGVCCGGEAKGKRDQAGTNGRKDAGQFHQEQLFRTPELL